MLDARENAFKQCRYIACKELIILWLSFTRYIMLDARENAFKQCRCIAHKVCIILYFTVFIVEKPSSILIYDIKLVIQFLFSERKFTVDYRTKHATWIQGKMPSSDADILLQGVYHSVCIIYALANYYKEDYNVSLFHVMCTVTVGIFCSRCGASLVYWPFAHLHLKAFFYLCTVSREKENKNRGQRKSSFPNQSTLLTLVKLAIQFSFPQRKFFVDYQTKHIFLAAVHENHSSVLL